MRRLRATLLLRCVLLGVSVAVVAVLVALGAGTGWAAIAIGSAFLLWFVGIEAGVLPWLLERMLVRRAGRHGKPVRSLWFVDLDAERAADAAAFERDTSDNPTLR